MTNARRSALLLGLTLFLAACGMPVEEEEVATPEPAQGVTIVRPTPGAPAATIEPATPSLGELPTCYQPTAEPVDAEATPVEPSQRIASPGPVPAPSRYEPLPLHEDADLEARLREVLGDDVDAYGIVVKSLEDGRGAVINPDKVFYAASLFKVAVLYEVFHQRALGLLDLQEELLVTPYYASFDLGTLPVAVCETISIEQALHAMTAFSDNTSAVLLQDRAGSANVNASMEALGLSTTRLLTEDLPTTAGDMALLMEMIARGRAVDEAASQNMVNLLAGEELDNGLRAGVPPETVVAHKTGNWSNATHDAGIVYASNAPYVIAILSEKAYETVLTAKLSAAVFEYYTGAGGGGGG
jgi:beta-lactamase class A